MQSPTHWCLKECPAHIKIQSSARLSLLTFACSVVCLLPQAYSNKLRLAALEAPVFHTLWCLAAQRKGMVIRMKIVHPDKWLPCDGISLEEAADTAVRCSDRHVLVVAGPGAGKTELLAQKAAFLKRFQNR